MVGSRVICTPSLHVCFLLFASDDFFVIVSACAAVDCASAREFASRVVRTRLGRPPPPVAFLRGLVSPHGRARPLASALARARLRGALRAHARCARAHARARVPRSPDPQIPGSPAPRMLGSPHFWIPRFPDPRIPGFTVRGCLDPVIPGSPDSLLRRSPDPSIP